MDSTDDGEQVTERRESLRLNKSELAREAGVNRDTLSDLEAGQGFHDKTLRKVLGALDRLEEEAGLKAEPRPIGDPADRLVEFHVEGVNGYRVILKGSLHDIETLRQTAEQLVAGLPRNLTSPE